MSDYPKVRAMSHCLCGDAKPDDTVLCWRCYRREKHFNDGGFGPETIELLNQLEASEVR